MEDKVEEQTDEMALSEAVVLTLSLSYEGCAFQYLIDSTDCRAFYRDLLADDVPLLYQRYRSYRI